MLLLVVMVILLFVFPTQPYRHEIWMLGDWIYEATWIMIFNYTDISIIQSQEFGRRETNYEKLFYFNKSKNIINTKTYSISAQTYLCWRQMYISMHTFDIFGLKLFATRLKDHSFIHYPGKPRERGTSKCRMERISLTYLMMGKLL